LLDSEQSHPSPPGRTPPRPRRSARRRSRRRGEDANPAPQNRWPDAGSDFLVRGHQHRNAHSHSSLPCRPTSIAGLSQCPSVAGAARSYQAATSSPPNRPPRAGRSCADRVRRRAVKFVCLGRGSICTTRSLPGVGVPQVTADYDAFRSQPGRPSIPVIGYCCVQYSGVCDISQGSLASGWLDTVVAPRLLGRCERGPGRDGLHPRQSSSCNRGMYNTLAAIGPNPGSLGLPLSPYSRTRGSKEPSQGTTCCRYDKPGQPAGAGRGRCRPGDPLGPVGRPVAQLSTWAGACAPPWAPCGRVGRVADLGSGGAVSTHITGARAGGKPRLHGIL